MYCLSQNTLHQSERGFRVTSQDKRSFLPSMPWSPEGGCVWQLAPSAGAVRLRIKEFDLEPYPADVVGDKIIIYSDDGQGTALFIESCETSDTCNFIWQDGTCINGGCRIKESIDFRDIGADTKSTSISLVTDRNDGGKNYRGVDLYVQYVEPCETVDCQCIGIRDACELGKSASCSVYANDCCHSAECRCKHMSKACSSSLDSALGDAALSQDCLDAEKACCKDCLPVRTLQGKGTASSCQCGCDFWGQYCTSHPSTCLVFAERCCGSPNDASHNSQCYCEMEGYLTQNTNIHLEYQGSCLRAKELEFLSDSNQEKEALVGIFDELGGAEWFNDDMKWLNKKEHCNWYGVSCDDNARVVEIDLSGNNLAGSLKSRLFESLNKLEVLKLADNGLTGVIEFNSFYHLSKLTYVDVSANNLSGEVDVLLSPALQYLNLSHNNFTSLVNFKFRGSQTTLEKLDLSYNGILQDIVHILENIPASLKELVLAENHIHGSLPNPLPVLSELYRFILTKNDMTGRIPDVSRSFPRLQELDLSHQMHATNTGLSGPIPTGWINLPDLVILDLSKNKLTNVIPPDIGSLPKLTKLFLSNNGLTGDIPTDFGKLASICEMLDLSNNALSRIPPELGEFGKSSESGELRSSRGALIKLIGNADIVAPAPLDLCYVPGFDLRRDITVCPSERNVLNKFYHAAKGREWTESENWVLSQNDHCLWHGVTCNKEGLVVGLALSSNGLSGKLDSNI